MTLPNLDRTDKDSIKWFILLPSGHEGPYSLNHLSRLRDKNKLSPLVRIWCEGLAEAMSLDNALKLAAERPAAEIVEPISVTPAAAPEPVIVPAPANEFPPPVPDEASVEPIEEPPSFIPRDEAVNSVTISRRAVAFVVVLGGIVVGTLFLAKGREEFALRRWPRMTPDLHERILRENHFDGWGKPIFFKEYVPRDHSQIWLVTSGFQACDIEAVFTSVPDRLLTLGDEKVSFVARGQLAGHVAELSEFDYRSGTKLIPGLYEMDVKATNCKWDGIMPRIMNLLKSPVHEYLARTKVILYSGGALAFHETLAKLLKKKEERIIKERGETALYWQDLQQKFETLEAITLQIEQHLLDFLEAPPGTHKARTKTMVDEYTRKYGAFLTSFVVDQEASKRYGQGVGAAQEANYALLIRMTAKQIGLESMKFIEEFLGTKSVPSPTQQAQFRDRVRKTYGLLKKDISQKLVQVSLDQAR